MGLPWKVISVAGTVQFAEGIQLTVLFPFVPFMVASFQGVSQEQVGTFSGLIGAGFAFGQLLSSYIWGVSADRFGEKFVIVISLGLTFACSLSFGFSQAVATAFLARFLAGLFNGNVGVVKTYLGKNTNAANQAVAMSLFSAAWVSGSIFGPAVGGLLAEPARHYPRLFSPDGLFARFPYLLPCLAASAVVLLSLVVCLLMMKDPRFERLLARCCPCLSLPVPCCPYWPRKRTRSLEMLPESSLLEVKGLQEGSLPLMETASGQEEEENGVARQSQEREEQEPKTPEAENFQVSEGEEEEEKEEEKEETELEQSDAAARSPPLSGLPKEVMRSMIFCIIMYGAVCFLFICLDEGIPLFCRAPISNGGLGFETNQVGIALSVMGFVNVSYIALIFPCVKNTFSKLVRIFFGPPPLLSFFMVADHVSSPSFRTSHL